MPKSRATVVALGIVLAVAVAAIGLIAPRVAPLWRRTGLDRVHAEALASGDWAAALEACVAERGLVSRDVDLLLRCDEAASRVAGAMSGEQDASEAAASVRLLAAWGAPAVLAEGLDRSRVVVRGGEFVMGSNGGRDNERPEHVVYVDSFEIDRFELTNVQYARFRSATEGRAPLYWAQGDYPAGQEDVPVVGVSWAEAQSYCEWAGGRLPTEAEWEKACRGTTANVYPWGNTWDAERANISLGREPTHGTVVTALYSILEATPSAEAPGLRSVGSFPAGASSYGLLDLAGNAAEWAADWYNWDGYWAMPTVNPVGEGPEWNRSLRGSPWYFRMGTAEEASLWSRCSARNSSHAWIDPRVGFRCAYPAR